MTKIVRHKKNTNAIFAILDVFITVFSYFLAYFLTNLLNKDYFAFTQEYLFMLLLIIPTWAILLYTHNLTQYPRIRSYVSVFLNMMNFSFVGFALMFFYKHLFNFTNFSHYFIISFSIVNLVSLYLFRMVTFRIFKYFRSNGHNISNAIIYADENSDKLLESIIGHREWGYRILMIITDSNFIRKKYGRNIRIYPDKITIKNILDIDIIDEVIYCKSSIDEKKLHSLIEICDEIGVTLRLQSNLIPNIYINKPHLEQLQNISFITFRNTPKNSFGMFWKSFTEFWISFTIIFMLSPIMLLIALGIKLTSRGPVIFKQERVGLRGRKFYIYKFRTMIQNAEELKVKLLALNESDGPAFKIKNDPRITPVGKLLRKTGLDELPQLFNVLKGEMSLIGPRPPLPSEVEKYERWHLKRLSVKPGITCTWQIIPNRNEVIFDNWMKLDIQYIESWSIKTDLKLFFQTIKTIIYGSGY
jgi:exopolysaccharide biosynthesis polyprenyl glycosylphosphotransferase